MNLTTDTRSNPGIGRPHVCSTPWAGGDARGSKVTQPGDLVSCAVPHQHTDPIREWCNARLAARCLRLHRAVAGEPKVKGRVRRVRCDLVGLGTHTVQYHPLQVWGANCQDLV